MRKKIIHILLVFLVSHVLWADKKNVIISKIKVDPKQVAKMVDKPKEDWLSLSLMGSKVGYAHIYTEPTTYQDQPAIKIRTHTVIQIQRTGTGLRLETIRTCYVGLDLIPLYFLSLSNETGQEKRVEGIIKNDEIVLKTTLAGITTDSRRILSPDTIFDSVIGYFTLHRGLQVGDTYHLNVFSMDLMKPVKTHIQVLQEDLVDHKPVFVIEYSMDIMGGITTREWVGADGVTHRMESGLMGLKLVLTRTDMSTALDGLAEVDVILNTKILSTGFNPLANSKKMSARVSLPNPEAAILTNQRQRLVALSSPGIYQLDVSTLEVLPAITRTELAKRVQGDHNLTQFLSPSVYVQSDHPSIIQTANDVVNNEPMAHKAANQLGSWVYEIIKNKNLQVGFASALQTLESKTGDCTEHTVLYVALARAIGLPARVCAGLVFQSDAFYYHFWPEVYVGEWFATDPTLGQWQADASHIQLAGSIMESDSMIEMGEGVMRTLNQLEIEILKTE